MIYFISILKQLCCYTFNIKLNKIDILVNLKVDQLVKKLVKISITELIKRDKTIKEK